VTVQNEKQYARRTDTSEVQRVRRRCKNTQHGSDFVAVQKVGEERERDLPEVTLEEDEA